MITEPSRRHLDRPDSTRIQKYKPEMKNTTDNISEDLSWFSGAIF